MRVFPVISVTVLLLPWRLAGAQVQPGSLDDGARLAATAPSAAQVRRAAPAAPGMGLASAGRGTREDAADPGPRVRAADEDTRAGAADEGTQATTAAARGTGSAPAPQAAGPSPGAQDASTAEALAFKPLDLPEWVVLDPREDTKGRPWILIVDDPQCPYCMQLSLALEKSRETGDPEISRAAIAHVPFPLAYHDQSAHIVSDAFCLEASRASQPWSAAAYLDWLIVAPWRAEPDWKAAPLDEIGKDGGFFDTRYDKHRVTSSRRREFQTERARAESACAADSCHGDGDCEKLCVARRTCVAACPEAGAGGAAGSSVSGAAAAASREKCLADCSDRFVSARYRQFSKVHSACLLEEGPGSAHAKTAAAYAWGVSHKVPGTPTVYVGHPAIGFRIIGDSDHLMDFLATLRRGISDARAKMSPSSPAPAAR